jgi:NAD-dependent dihydropyrimidine dehydrogenase PreA subunit
LPRREAGPGYEQWSKLMAYAIAEPCIGVKDTACVDICPVDCIHPRKDEGGFAGARQLYINPDECLDCGACVPACPVAAIFTVEDFPVQWRHFADANAEFCARAASAPDAT